MVSRSEGDLKKSTRLIDTLRQQIIGLGQVPSDVDVDPAETITQSDLVAKFHITEAKLNAIEKLHAESKMEKIKLQKVIGTLKAEVEEYKIQFEELQIGGVNSNPTLGQKTWFKGFATATIPAPASTVSTPAVPLEIGMQSQSLGLSQTPTVSTSNLAVPTNPPVSTSTTPVRSWWARTAVSATSTQPGVTLLSPLTITGSSASIALAPTQDPDLKVKALEQQLDLMKEELNIMASKALKELPSLPEKSHEIEGLRKELQVQLEAVAFANSNAELLGREIENQKVSLDHTDTQMKKLETESIANIQLLAKGSARVLELEDELSKLQISMTLKHQRQIDSLSKDIDSQKQLVRQQSQICRTQATDLFELNLKVSSKSEQLVTLTGDIRILQATLSGISESNPNTELSVVQEEFKNQIHNLKTEFENDIMKKQSDVDYARKNLNSLQVVHEALAIQHCDLLSEKALLDALTETEKTDLSEQSDILQNKFELLLRGMQIKEEEFEAFRVISVHNAACLNESVLGQVQQNLTIKDLESKLINIEAEKSKLCLQIVSYESQLAENNKKLPSSNQYNNLDWEKERKHLQDEIVSKTTDLQHSQEKIKTYEQNSGRDKETASGLAQKATILSVEIEKKTAETISLSKKVENTQHEIEILHKQIRQGKETSEFLSKSLQDQINQLLDSKAASDKKLRAELDEKFKKDKLELEAGFKKEKLEFEEKGKKLMIEGELRGTKEKVETEEKVKKEKSKLVLDLEKLRKDYDTLKADSSKKEELVKTQARVKSLEGELVTLKAEQSKLVDGLNLKVSELSKDQISFKETQIKLTTNQEDLTALQAKYDLVMQENEVAHANYERNLKGVTEKEDVIKKLKAAKDDIHNSEKTLKSSLVRLEREKEVLQIDNSALKSRIETQLSLIEGEKKTAEIAIEQAVVKVKSMEAELDRFRSEKEKVEKKLEETDHELSVSGRKAAQMVKDLQKQLAKQRKGGIEEEPTSKVSVHLSANEDLMSLSQENEALTKRATMFEEEV